MRILNVKDSAVLRGVEGKNVVHEPDLIEVTFVDDNNTPRTVFAHRDGPFRTPEDIARAAIDGTLHPFTEHPPPPETPPPPQGLVTAGNFPVG